MDEKKAGLVNLILQYAIENEMAFDSVMESVEMTKEVFLSDGIIRKHKPEDLPPALF